jgi:cell shape-determining protein MreC
MSQAEWFTTYLEYETLKDLLKVILYTSQSFMSITPLLYYINYQDRDILFIHTGIVGGVVAHYHIISEKPTKKFIELNKLTGEFEFVENIGSNSHSIYVPIVGLRRSTLRFPTEIHSTNSQL